MNKAVIELQNIKRNFQVGDETVHALRGVSFTIREGEFVTIMGTSGSGKSTLLNTLGCLDTPTSGEYLLDGISVRTMSKPQRAVLRNRKIGFVFQSYNLLPKTTAVENVELPLMYNSSVSASERRRRAIEALQAVGLGDRLEHKSNQMSGGQMQRPEQEIRDATISAAHSFVTGEKVNMVERFIINANLCDEAAYAFWLADKDNWLESLLQMRKYKNDYYDVVDDRSMKETVVYEKVMERILADSIESDEKYLRLKKLFELIKDYKDVKLLKLLLTGNFSYLYAHR